ncbi:MAG: pantoate kinase [Candidatus Heimdallarchaeaceae archaeon]
MSKFWVASHITGIFTIEDEHPDPLQKGSLGAGFSISRGTTTWVESSDDNKNHFFFNGREVSSEEANISNYILDYIQELSKSQTAISIFHEFEVPLSCGFGASASGALGSVLALNEHLDLDLSKPNLFQIAHRAEVINGGGLGDVIGLLQGGWEYRTKAGAPGIGEAKNILENSYKVATLNLGPIETKAVIKNEKWKQQINKVGQLFLSSFFNKPSISDFATISKQFAITSYLATPDVIQLIQDLESEDCLTGQIMLGNGIFLIYKNRSALSSIDNYIEEEICYNTIKRYD